MTIKLFLFDLDGTLIDTAPTLVAAANRVIAEAGGTRYHWKFYVPS